ncbi:MAPEG family protein [Brucella intermedia]|uniref:MAPEG family protein n=1 Tax=Brucella intermedia TaxID=94625 RepID=UPI0021CA9CC2|nr:MAPEG family protein [Brucella intermedia]UXO82858.1 MAPEG family protein [Brucella intermedia]
MEPGLFSASSFLPLIGGSVVLLVVHILLQGFAATKELGSRWNAGPRDEGLKPSGKFAGRAERASANFRETYPAFIGLALALVLKGDPSGWGILGAWLWLLGRIVYIPLYLAGIPYFRSFVWLISLVGLGIMLLALVL